jgi:hypothetical protein
MTTENDTPRDGVEDWLFYFTDDEGTPFAMIANGRDGLYGEVAEWLTGDCGELAVDDDGEDMIAGVVDTLIENGEFRPEGDKPCFARRLAPRPKPAAGGVAFLERWHEEISGMVPGNRLYDDQQEWVKYADAISYGDARAAAADRSAQFYRRRCELLQQWQAKMRDPERTIVCDILANGQMLPDPNGTRYGAAAVAAKNPAAEAIEYHSAVGPIDAMAAAFSAMDNSDTELEEWPQRAIDALAFAGWAVVPYALPYTVLGEAGISGVFETGNPKHGWDWLVAKTRIGPHGPPEAGAVARHGGDDPSWFGQLPGPIGNPEAWPENYAGGYNDALALCYDVIRQINSQPAAPVAVDEAVSRALDAKPFAEDGDGTRVWQFLNPQHSNDKHRAIMRAALTAADCPEQVLDMAPAHRKRVSEIEDAILSGSMNAYQCFTQMRQIIVTQQSNEP